MELDQKESVNSLHWQHIVHYRPVTHASWPDESSHLGSFYNPFSP